MSKKIFLILTLTLILITVTGCTTRYVCYDGTVERQEEKCPTANIPSVHQRDAEKIAENYATTYARAVGDTSTRLNIYRVEGNWHSDVLFSNQRTGKISQVTLQVGGRQPTITCISGCEYLNRDVNETTINTNTQDNEQPLITI